MWRSKTRDNVRNTRKKLRKEEGNKDIKKGIVDSELG
jgi:hypothetical protein